ncbi:efflux transporter outer membrane subunit [Niveibacterium terrae]|uniref:efflux transporter outer membrane subunit n=1 Tax=Niveibacterium terrae TaxID=3373598 RepID=UPI003A93921E
MPQPSTASLRRRVLLTTLALAVTGCAQIPPQAQPASPKGSQSYETAQSFAVPAANGPDERWWQAYDDPQLDTLIQEALRDSPDMAAASARLRRADALEQVAGAALMPELSANGSVTEQRQSYNYLTPKAMTPEGWKDYGRATLDFSWELDFWGKNRAALAAASSDIEASRAEFAQTRLSLAAAIASEYVELARLFEARDTAKRSVELRKKTAALFAERFANGLETMGSLKAAESRRAAAEGELLQAEERIGLQRYRLAALLGAGPDRGLSIERPSVNLHREIGLPSSLAADLLGRRPDVSAARLRAQAQLRRIDQKKAEFYPNINLAGFVGLQSLGLNLLAKEGSTTGSIGPAISLPIFNGGRLKGELRNSVATYDEAVANYDRTVTVALQEVANAVLSQRQLAGRLAKSQEALAAADEAHRIARNRYEGGLSSYLEVLSAEDTLLESQRALTDLQSRRASLDVALMRALGGGYRETHLASN